MGLDYEFGLGHLSVSGGYYCIIKVPCTANPVYRTASVSHIYCLPIIFSLMDHAKCYEQSILINDRKN